MGIFQRFLGNFAATLDRQPAHVNIEIEQTGRRGGGEIREEDFFGG
jgi:hypothetical protein